MIMYFVYKGMLKLQNANIVENKDIVHDRASFLVNYLILGVQFTEQSVYSDSELWQSSEGSE